MERRASTTRWIGVALGSFVLGGCAATAPGPDWPDLLPSLERAVQERPEDPEAWTQLGLAHDFLEEDEAARGDLERALALAPGSIEAGLPLVRLHLDAGDTGRANEVLDSLQPLLPEDVVLVRSARLRLEQTRLIERMQALARGETEAAVAMPAGTIGVLEFPMHAPADAGADEGAEETTTERYRGLGRALAAVITTELGRLPEVRVLERQNLQVLMDEITLIAAQSGSRPPRPPLDPIETVRGLQQRLALLRPDGGGTPFYDGSVDGVSGPGTTQAVRAFQASRGLAADGVAGPRTRRAIEEAIEGSFANAPAVPEREPADGAVPRAGRLLGARHLLGGEVAVVGDAAISVRSRVVDSRDGALVSEADFQTSLDEFHRVPGEIVLATAEDLALPLDETARRRLRDLPPPTRSLAAFLAFGRGLEHEDRGLWREASAEYETALRLAPEFALAQERAAAVQIGSASFEQSLHRTVQALARSLRTPSRAAGEALGAVGTGTKEGERRDDSADGSRAVQSDGPLRGEVLVHGQVPVGR